MSEKADWISTRDLMPQEGVEVATKIDDQNGCRNVASLVRHRGLWFFPDMSMYVYYSPTHWKAIPPQSSNI